MIIFNTINDEYKLSLSSRFSVELEKKLGRSVLSIISECDDNNLPSTTDMIAFLWASLQRYNHGIKYDDCFDIFDDYVESGKTCIDFFFVMIEVLQDGGYIPKISAIENEEENEGN